MLFAFLVGTGLVIQVGFNMAVSRALGGAVYGTLSNFLVGTTVIAVFMFLTRQALPAREAFVGVPAWAWFGGVFGALYVGVATFAGPRLGALLLLALTVAGQMLASVIIDHFGLLGFPQHPVSAGRVAGVVLLIAGIWLVATR